MRFVIQFRAFQPFQPFQAFLTDGRTMLRRCHWGDAQRALGLPRTVGTARRFSRFALSPGAAVGTGLEQTRRRTNGATAIGALDSVPGLLRQTGRPQVQPESGRLGERLIRSVLASLAPVIMTAFFIASRRDGSRTVSSTRGR